MSATNRALLQYARAIRNPAKRAYALAYITNPDAEPTGLSYMGAQAVRLRVAEIRRPVDRPGCVFCQSAHPDPQCACACHTVPVPC